MGQIPTWVWIVSLLLFGPKLYYAFQVGRRRKGEVAFRLKRSLVAFLAYGFGVYIAFQTGHSGLESVIFGFIGGIAASFFFVQRPKRDRRIPKRVRAAVIARDLKGADFDATLHHIDHIVPYSRGGDHSVENLRVLPKKDNLSRGARMPKMRDFRKTS